VLPRFFERGARPRAVSGRAGRLPWRRRRRASRCSGASGIWRQRRSRHRSAASTLRTERPGPGRASRLCAGRDLQARKTDRRQQLVRGLREVGSM